MSAPAVLTVELRVEVRDAQRMIDWYSGHLTAEGINRSEAYLTLAAALDQLLHLHLEDWTPIGGGRVDVAAVYPEEG